MKIEMTPLEARVIGCLIEKQVTTPDQYPLSLNALVNACNQKNNRDPVLSLGEREVQELLDSLSHKHLVVEKSGFGSRVVKYAHRFCNTEFNLLQLTAQELAIMCELMLRGAQTPGELRARASRMAEFTDIAQIEATLEALASREPHPLVTRLGREPGRREARYAHLLCGPVAELTLDLQEPAAATPRVDRLAQLEEEVARLRREVDELRQAIHGSGQAT